MSEKKADRHARTHAAILKSGGRRFREKGYAATSLRDVMGDSGLTVGGFYAHFKCKSDLFAACFRQAAAEGSEKLFSEVGPGKYLETVKRYLGDRHVRDKGGGCPLAALLSELDQFQRENLSPLVEATVTGFSRELVLRGADPERVLGLLALMLGALTLARSVKDESLHRQILKQSLDAAAGFRKRRKRKEKP